MDHSNLIDLASEKLGGTVLYANDDFFAPKENLLKPTSAIWKEGEYTDRGKWMDGWETRRRRSPRLDEPFDWCVIRLGLAGEIQAIIVDTAFFKGNYPSHCAVDACVLDSQSDENLKYENQDWREILPMSELIGDTKNEFEISPTDRVTHVRLRIYPDGGVARLRVLGNVLADLDALRVRDSEIDLAAVENGGSVPVASDMFFGHRQNLIMPGLARDMSDGWESKRRRGPGHDWCIVKLGSLGTISRVEIDTSHFKGNYPESCSLEGASIPDGNVDNASWRELLPMTKLQAHTRHTFIDHIVDLGPVTHVRLNIFPDGGVSRLRLFGRLA